METADEIKEFIESTLQRYTILTGPINSFKIFDKGSKVNDFGTIEYRHKIVISVNKKVVFRKEFSVPKTKLSEIETWRNRYWKGILQEIIAHGVLNSLNQVKSLEDRSAT